MVRSLSAVFLAAAVALGACDRLGAGRAPAPAPAKAPEIGRYVIVHSPQVERDVILLDTATGQTWSRIEVTDMVGEPVAWDPMPQFNSPADVSALADVHGWKKGSTQKEPAAAQPSTGSAAAPSPN